MVRALAAPVKTFYLNPPGASTAKPQHKNSGQIREKASNSKCQNSNLYFSLVAAKPQKVTGREANYVCNLFAITRDLSVKGRTEESETAPFRQSGGGTPPNPYRTSCRPCRPEGRVVLSRRISKAHRGCLTRATITETWRTYYAIIPP